MLETAQGVWTNRGMRLAVVLDTFVRAAEVFDTDPRFLTRPATLTTLVLRFPAITFVGAHMGGLAADFDELSRDLPPAENLYLDTSNAAHTLSAEQFVQLLQRHGSRRIIFGTDWPWFGHGEEVPKILELLERAGFDDEGVRRVMRDNAERLLFPPG
jgi:predicted TIM-barrel fold metal-dependent hydrolase